ncbi:MAG: 3'(2'),5'-bisphosphate nucleotidase CysQ [Paracoccaceae bacterium]|nr:3'(2'),5'-bisphosphate nucleotidase CysQ [Paracoccaceae bacterium]
MPAPDLDLLVEAAREAGDIALGHWRRDPQVWDKGGDDPVSEADLAVDAHLKTRLLAARPEYGWLSEETPDTGARLATERVFVVDPIDGTRAFIDGQETWAHSLAVVERGRVTAGVVYLPAKDRLFAAAAGQGAFCNGDPIRASGRTDPSGANVLANRANFDARHWRVPPDDLARSFRPSLAYRLALVGQGRFDAMLTLRDAWEWDIAAGTLIAAEAGATVTDRTGAALSFNAPGAKAPGVLAAGPGVHAALIARLAPRPAA